jgi:hypothetical protein
VSGTWTAGVGNGAASRSAIPGLKGEDTSCTATAGNVSCAATAGHMVGDVPRAAVAGLGSGDEPCAAVPGLVDGEVMPNRGKPTESLLQ